MLAIKGWTRWEKNMFIRCCLGMLQRRSETWVSLLRGTMINRGIGVVLIS